MAELWKKLRTALSSDRGDGVLVTTLIAIPLLLLVMGFSIDLNRSVNVGIAYNSMAQASVETGVKSLDARGSMGNRAVEAFVREYRVQSGNGANGGTAETQAYNSAACATAKVEGVERRMPYIVVTLGTERGSGKQVTSTWTVEGNDAVPTKALGNGVYRVISADVYNSSTNLFGMLGLAPCQVHKSSVSAIAFGSNSDLP